MPLLRVGPRLAGAKEWLDEPQADSRAVARTLADLRAINRLLGYRRGVVRDAWPLVARAAREAPGRAVTLLDAGAGSADVALALAARATRAGLPVAVVALDQRSEMLEAARAQLAAAGRVGPTVRLVRGDALALPLAEGTVDVCVASLLVHHLDGEAAVRLLAELRRVARVGVVVSDLVRHPLALLGFRLLTRLWPVHPITRHDGALSVRRAYTGPELSDLARRAGLGEGGGLRRHLFWRMAWIWSAPARPGAGAAPRHRAAAPFGVSDRASADSGSQVG